MKYWDRLIKVISQDFMKLVEWSIIFFLCFFYLATLHAKETPPKQEYFIGQILCDVDNFQLKYLGNDLWEFNEQDPVACDGTEVNSPLKRVSFHELGYKMRRTKLNSEGFVTDQESERFVHNFRTFWEAQQLCDFHNAKVPSISELVQMNGLEAKPIAQHGSCDDVLPDTVHVTFFTVGNQEYCVEAKARWGYARYIHPRSIEKPLRFDNNLFMTMTNSTTGSGEDFGVLALASSGKIVDSNVSVRGAWDRSWGDIPENMVVRCKR